MTVSSDAIVDVRRRRRRQEIFLGNVSDTARTSNFKLFHHLALDSLDISTGNDATVYFWSERNRMNVFIFGSRFLDNTSTDFEKFTEVERVIQVR